MQIQRFHPQPAPLPAAKVAPKAPEPPVLDDYSYSMEVGTGALFGAIGAIPVVGAITNWTTGHALDPAVTGDFSRFDAVASLASRGAAIANVAGTWALATGQPQLALGLLLGGGLVSGTAFALAMDGGSLAHHLGLKD